MSVVLIVGIGSGWGQNDGIRCEGRGGCPGISFVSELPDSREH